MLQYHYGKYSAVDIAAAAGSSNPDILPRNITGKMQSQSREARSNQRRLLTAFGSATASDLLKFNQLKVNYQVMFQIFSLNMLE
jgi:histone-lysine N-methyltransferase SETD1